MSLIDRAEFIQTLEQGWGTYLAGYQRLSPQAQQDFLRRQGYLSLDGLLAHVIAWWEDGTRVIQRMQSDAGFQNPDYDVDAFNAAASSRAGESTVAITDIFEQRRAQMAALVVGLSEDDLADERINTRLRYEIIVHMQEHLLDG